MVVAGKFHLWDLRKSSVGIRIARSHLSWERLGDETNPLTPADSIILLPLVYVQKCILVFKSVERVQIGALLHFESCIDEIVLNFRHDPNLHLQVRGDRTFRPRQRDKGQERICMQIDAECRQSAW